MANRAGSTRKSSKWCLLLNCLFIIAIILTGCAGRQDEPIEWKETEILGEEDYQLISVEENIKDGERLSDIRYCDGNIYYFMERTVDSMLLYPEYYTVKCMDVETGKTEILYEAPKYHVLQDLIAAEDRLYWVEWATDEEVSNWEIVSYEPATGEITVLREGVFGEDTNSEPILTLSGRYILWDEYRVDKSLHSFMYSLDDCQVIEKQTQDLNFYNPYIGNRVYRGELVYLAGEDNAYTIRTQEDILYELPVESVMDFHITDSGVLWTEENLEGGNLERNAWFAKRGHQGLGEAEMLPYQDVFSAELYGNRIALRITPRYNGENRYYLLEVDTGERHRLPVEGSMFPWCSADGVIYFEGYSEGHGDCVLIIGQ